MLLLSNTRLWLLVSVVLAACTAAHRQSPPEPPSKPGTGEPVTLNVALFPWIPDAAEDGFTALKQRLEVEFEARYPGVDLVLRLNPGDDSYYKPARVAGWLAGGQYDLVEIDTVILGDLVDAEVIAPWPIQSDAAFFNAAKQGSTFTGKQRQVTWWGIPHYQCGYFVISHSPAIIQAQTLTELIAAVEANGLPLFGNFDSSWDLPSLYLDAVIDNDAQATALNQSVQPPLNHDAASALDQIASLCKTQEGNPCVDGTFRDQWQAPVQRFVAGEASALWGYSERLHLIVKQLRQSGLSADSVQVAAMPQGREVKPLLFTDAFVRSAGCAQDQGCDLASQAFATFINSPWAIKEIFLSGDTAATGQPMVPRYLLPAAQSAFAVPEIQNDRFYQALKPYLETGHAMPNDAGLYERRRVLAWLLSQTLKPL